MDEISIKIKEIERSIENMQTLKNLCASFGWTRPTTIGGGNAVSQIEKMGELYDMTAQSVEMLLSSTVSFLQNIKDSFVSSDQRIASEITN